jgi:prepilin-type N-terminal cleavage/methylation domain-containing protein
VKNRGTTLIELVIVLAVVGVAGTWAFKPEWLPGTAARRAKKSQEATQQVQSATQRVDDATRHQVEEMSAGLTAIGKANDQAPESPSKDFISLEVPYLIGLSPFKASAAALLNAERRRAAVMEGERDEARRLYQQAYNRAEQLERERNQAVAALARANEARREIDQQYAEIAAAEHARTTQLMGAAVIIILVGAAYLWLRFHSVSLSSVGKMAADIRGGRNPLDAIDAYVDDRLHETVRHHAKLAQDVKG